jgi:galactokinase
MTDIQKIKEVQIASPGRINLIGEHIDYNGGFVLPAAIDKRIYLNLKVNNSKIASVYSKNLNETFSFSLEEVSPSKTEWHNYILGVVHYIHQLKPNSIHGFDCIIESNLPLGSGVSSSAALECGMAKGLNELFSIGLTDVEMITLSRDAEHTFVGTKCGIMDQFAVVFGKKDHLLLLNCDTLEHYLIKADFGEYKIILLNTNVSHNLASSEYNKRREECETALKIIQESYPEARFLAQVLPATIIECKDKLPSKIYERAMYVSQENERTIAGTKALENKDFETFGDLLYQSHTGLSNLYEVSCTELDFLVDFTKNVNEVLGARMMGGGFGGCTINLVHQDAASDFISKIGAAYKNQFNVALTPITVAIGDGVLKI